ncbi:Homeodomain-interacting protein kinase 2 [Nibea albiflora]|uniref:Homeodomain-interacting protein kinase 2 n=1 Tax=Nibea albiflora TaxID=240163 RepID=A0ACB7FDB1_NIBAL|nr:Homeodomain-interacting protein kinase 2 [Nibea albiflora]
MTGYGTHSKVYSHNSSKNLSAASGPLGINSSLQVASSTLPYEQALIFPASTGHIVVASASSTSGAVGSLLSSGGGGSSSNSSWWWRWRWWQRFGRRGRRSQPDTPQHGQSPRHLPAMRA